MSRNLALFGKIPVFYKNDQHIFCIIYFVKLFYKKRRKL